MSWPLASAAIDGLSHPVASQAEQSINNQNNRMHEALICLSPINRAALNRIPCGFEVTKLLLNLNCNCLGYIKTKCNLQTKISLEKPFCPWMPFLCPKPWRSGQNKKATKTQRLRRPSLRGFHFKVMRVLTIRGSSPDFPRLYDTEKVLSTIVR